MYNITYLVQRLGIHATYQGYHYLCYGLNLCLGDEHYVLFVWKWLYTDIGRHFGKSRESVEHALRTVVSICWNSGNRALLEEINGFPLVSKPTVGEFFSILYQYLERGTDSN